MWEEPNVLSSRIIDFSEDWLTYIRDWFISVSWHSIICNTRIKGSWADSWIKSTFHWRLISLKLRICREWKPKGHSGLLVWGFYYMINLMKNGLKNSHTHRESLKSTYPVGTQIQISSLLLCVKPHHPVYKVHST